METIERPRLNGTSQGAVHTVTVPGKPRRPRMLRAAAAIVVVVALIVGGVLVYRARTAAAPRFVTVPVAQRDLVQTVSATGTVNPQNTISVGTQQSGTISELDVDYNSKVHTGQVLARLDTTALQAQVDSARASLAQAQQQARAAGAAAAGADANIAVAEAGAQAARANARAAAATAQANQQAIAAAQANVTKSQSALALAQQTVARDRALLAQGFIPQNQLDTDQSNLVAAQSTLSSAQTAVGQARSQAAASLAQAQASQAQISSQSAAVTGAQAQSAGSGASAAASQAAIGIQAAQLAQAENNLAHAVITSPVDGTVVARGVSVGQTVAASFQTPTLFTIAQDLSKMEVDLAVGEPDIGAVKPGEDVAFTVLAFPNDTFNGRVSQVRKNPTITQNVVTYTAVVLVDNKQQKLLPGMTANATISVAKQGNALVVPLAALTYVPDGAGRRGGASRTGSNAGANPAANAQRASQWGTTGGASATTIGAGSGGRVFVERNGKLVRIPVQVNLVAGTQAAVTVSDDSLDDLKPGDQVVTGQSGAQHQAGSSRGGNGNPFQPQGGGSMRGFRG
jgi:HlyD family secretion protein